MDNHREVKALINVKVNYFGYSLTYLAVLRGYSLLFFILKQQVFAKLWVLFHECIAHPSVELSFRMEGNFASFQLTLC